MRDNCTKERCQKDSHPQGDLLEKLELEACYGTPLSSLDFWPKGRFNVFCSPGEVIAGGFRFDKSFQGRCR